MFEQQTRECCEMVLLGHVHRRLAIEEAASFGRVRHVGLRGAAVGRRTFGTSAPLQEQLRTFGFSIDDVITHARRLIEEDT